MQSIDRAQRLRERFQNALDEPEAPISELAATWKTLAEAEKVESEILNAGKSSRFERLKFWIPIVVSLVSTGALVATVIFQVFQFRENTRLTKEAAEDTQWREALKSARVTSGPEGAFGVTLLKSFFDSPRYGEASREVATQILGHMADEDVFNSAFSEVVARTRWWNIKDIALISKQLQDGFFTVTEKLDRLTERRNAIKASVPPDQVDHRLKSTDDEVELLTREKYTFENEIVQVSTAAVRLLRTQENQTRSNEYDFVLNGLQFAGEDLSNLDFHDAKLRDTVFSNCDVTGCDFGGLTENEFSNSRWNGTAWWKAKRISPELLKYLVDRWKFDPTQTYLNDKVQDPAEYEKAVQALSSANK